jgi:hypothetical protein
VKNAVETSFHSTAAGLYVLAASGLVAALLIAMLRPAQADRRAADSAEPLHAEI